MIKITTIYGETVWVAKAHVVSITRDYSPKTDKVYRVSMSIGDEYFTKDEIWHLFA